MESPHSNNNNQPQPASGSPRTELVGEQSSAKLSAQPPATAPELEPSSATAAVTPSAPNIMQLEIPPGYNDNAPPVPAAQTAASFEDMENAIKTSIENTLSSDDAPPLRQAEIARFHEEMGNEKKGTKKKLKIIEESGTAMPTTPSSSDIHHSPPTVLQVSSESPSPRAVPRENSQTQSRRGQRQAAAVIHRPPQAIVAFLNDEARPPSVPRFHEVEATLVPDAVQVPTVVARADPVVAAASGEREGRRKKNVVIGAVATVVLLAVGITVGVVVSNNKHSPSVDVEDIIDYSLDAPIPDGVTGIGCFTKENSADTRELGQDNIIEDCSRECLSKFFGIFAKTCACFVDNLDKRLSLGRCSSVANSIAPPSQRMEMFFKQGANDVVCSQKRTETVRNFLVEEDDTAFGFDIVENLFRSSPFKLFKDECGTNIYEVNTEVSEGSQFLDTSVEDIPSFATRRRSERTASLENSAEASYNGLFFSAAMKVSASADTSQTNLFKSSGASEANSRVFTSIGVKRLAEIKIVDFDDRRHFITFSSAFGNALREYQDSGYGKKTAYQIIHTYGQFVLTRGIFGGYMQLRTTMLGSIISSSFESEQRAKECYEASVSAEAKRFGFKAKGGVGGQCTEDALTLIRESRNTFETEVLEQTVVGGRRECSNCEDFTVEASDAVLLATKDKYPAGDRDGAKFRLLSDFLTPDKVSPMEIRRLQISERQFAVIQTNLQDHILDYISEVGETLDLCNCTIDQLHYLDEEDANGEQQCKCYSTIIDISTELSLNDENNYSKSGNRRSCAWDRCPSDGFVWQIGDCECKHGIDQCYLEGEPTTINRFDTATLTLTDDEGVWKMEATGRDLLLGQGRDKASGSACFDDPLRGGFRVDLSDTKYEFADKSAVIASGWSTQMRMVVDGTRLDDFSVNAIVGTKQVAIPPGTRVVEVICGGWGGGCTSELFVKLKE